MSLFDKVRAVKEQSKTEIMPSNVGKIKTSKANDNAVLSVTTRTILPKPKAKEPRSLVSWLQYAPALTVYAKDFELLVNANNEIVNISKRIEVINTTISNCRKQGLPVYTQRCNKSGQPIGVLIGLEFGDTATNAPQWIFTGENDLKRHAKNEPIAYATYSLSFIIDQMFNKNEFASRAKYKGLVYDALNNNTKLLQFVQFFSYTMSVVRYYDGNRFKKACDSLVTAYNSVNFNHNDLIQSFASVLNLCFNSPMPKVACENDYEYLETWIYNKFKIMKLNQKLTKDFHALQRTINENFSDTVKSTRVNKHELFARKVKLKENVEALGDIF